MGAVPQRTAAPASRPALPRQSAPPTFGMTPGSSEASRPANTPVTIAGNVQRQLHTCLVEHLQQWDYLPHHRDRVAHRRIHNDVVSLPADVTDIAERHIGVEVVGLSQLAPIPGARLARHMEVADALTVGDWAREEGVSECPRWIRRLIAPHT